MTDSLKGVTIDINKPSEMTHEMLEKFNRLLINEAKQRECKRNYMRRIRAENREKTNEYRRDLYKRQKEARKNVKAHIETDNKTNQIDSIKEMDK